MSVPTEQVALLMQEAFDREAEIERLRETIEAQAVELKCLRAALASWKNGTSGLAEWWDQEAADAASWLAQRPGETSQRVTVARDVETRCQKHAQELRALRDSLVGEGGTSG